MQKYSKDEEKDNNKDYKMLALYHDKKQKIYLFL